MITACRIHILVLTLLLSMLSRINAQELLVFKQLDSIKLFLEVHNPPGIDTLSNCPAMIFYFGGGWNGGDRSHFKKHAEYFSKRGIVCFLADYRTFKKHGVPPFECLKDAKSAIRYIRSNAADLRIDPHRIIASGGSAGGHLAAATSVIPAFNHKDDDKEVSCVPNALVLFNPVIDNGPGGYGFERIGNKYKDFSPLHNLSKDTPPTIIFLGTKDKLIPVETMKYYQLVMNKLGIECELRLYKDQEHGFFNYRNFDYYKETVEETDSFLKSLGYLIEIPQIAIE